MDIKPPHTVEQHADDTKKYHEAEGNQRNPSAEPDEAVSAPEETGASAASGWQAAFDPSSEAWYYFNIATGERSWTPPTSWETSTQEKDIAVPSTAARAAPPTAPAAPTGGYFYIDANGVTQGPYTKENLIAWRGMLPMDLPLWYEEQPEIQEQQEGGDQEGGEDTELLANNKQNILPNNNQGASSEAAIAKTKSTVDLASITEDSHLLALWRSKHPEAANATCAAPNAAAFQYEIEDPLYTALQTNDDGLEGEKEATTSQRNSLHSSLAAAALAGLPPDDEAVKLARAATLVGKSLQDVVAWNNNLGNYTATAMHSAGRGRVISSDVASESLYASMGSWADPASVEEQLQRAKERGKRKLTREEVKVVKAAQQQKKEKKLRAWLQD